MHDRTRHSDQIPSIPGQNKFPVVCCLEIPEERVGVMVPDGCSDNQKGSELLFLPAGAGRLTEMIWFQMLQQ